MYEILSRVICVQSKFTSDSSLGFTIAQHPAAIAPTKGTKHTLIK